MRGSSQKDMGVFDFEAEEEAVEAASARLLSKFTKRGNPRVEESASLKYAFLETFSSDIKQTHTSDVLCVDIDVSDGDQKCTAHIPSATSTSERDLATLREASVTDRNLVSPTSYNGLSRISENRSEDGSLSPKCFREDPHEIRVSSILTAAGNKEYTYNLSEIPSNGNTITESSDDDDSWMSSYSISSPTSGHAEIEGSVDLPASDDCQTGFGETENTDMAVIISTDFAIYEGKLYGEPQLTFFSDCIKIACSGADGIEEAFVSEWAIADVIHINCHWSHSAGTALFKVHLRPSAVIGAEKIHDACDTEVLIFGVSDYQWSEKEERIILLAPRYNDIWNNEPDAEMELEVDNFIGPTPFLSKHFLTDFTELYEDVVYPKGDPDAVSISKRDIELLQPDTFINDTIIDFYIKFLKNKIHPQENNRFHFFNSFFFRKLVDLDKDPGCLSEGRAAFLRVRKWTRKVNIFEKDYIFIPVNFNLHWSLLVICHPGEVAFFKEKEIDQALKVPCVLHMDSIKGSHTGLKNLIQSYLWEEWKERHTESPDHISSNFSNLRFVSPELPQQENSFDCGLFLLHYVELFLIEAPINVSPLKIVKNSNFLNIDWFIPAEASHKRFVIRDLLCNLLNDTSQKGYAASCSNGHISSEFPEKNIGNEPFLVLSSHCSAEKTGIGISACSNGDRGSEHKLLDISPPGSVHCDKEAGVVLQHFLESKPASSPHDNMSDPNQKSSTCTMNLIEEGVETDEQFVYANVDKSNYQPAIGVSPTEICTISYASNVVAASETPWKPEISMRIDPVDGDSSFEPLTCTNLISFEQNSFKMSASDNNSPSHQGRHSGISNQEEERERRVSSSPEDHGDVLDSPASGDLPEACIVEDSMEEVDTDISETKDHDNSFPSSQGNNPSPSCECVGSSENGTSLDGEDLQQFTNTDLVLGLERQPEKRQKLSPFGVRMRTRSFTRNCCS